jgi:spore germination protein KB
MIEKGKIANRQAMFLLVSGILATGLLIFPSLVTAEAKQDAWIAVALSSLAGLAVIWVTVSLSSRFPAKTIIEYSEAICGQIPGKAVGAVFIWFFLLLTALAVREFAEFIRAVFMEETQLAVFISSMLVIAAYAVYGGLEVIARVNELMLTLVLLAILLFMALATNQMDPARLTPVFAAGTGPIFKGAFVASGWYGEVLALAFLFPYLNRPALARRYGIGAVGILLGVFIIAITAAIMTFGPAETGRMQFPAFMVARNISIMGIFEHTEAIFMLLWIAGMFAKITIYFYISVLGAAQWLQLIDYRPLTLPLGTIIGGLSFIAAPNNPELVSFIHHVWSPYALTVELGLPVILLMITLIRKKGQSNR